MVTLILIAKLTDDSGNPLPNKTITFSKSTNGTSYSIFDQKTTGTDGTAISEDTITSSGNYYYKVEFAGDSEYEGSSAVQMYSYTATSRTPSNQSNNRLWLIAIIALALIGSKKQENKIQ